MTEMAKYIHIGAGKCKHEGFINLTQADLDISKPWPYEDESIDGVISMQVLQQLYWRDLMKALKEAHRVLKKGGVMRFGTMLVDHNDPEYALGWENINLFSFDLLKRVLGKVGFWDIKMCRFQETAVKEFKQVDNRPVGLGTAYVECEK